MQTKRWGNEYHTTMICIDSYEASVPKGRFYNLYYPEGLSFHGVIDLVKKIENMLDQMRFPQAFSQLRSFAEKPIFDVSEPVNEVNQTGELATFALRVLFRQNTSWQGSITWLEQKVDKSFRSALELVFLMDSALGGCRQAPHRRPSGYALGGQEALKSSFS